MMILRVLSSSSLLCSMNWADPPTLISLSTLGFETIQSQLFQLFASVRTDDRKQQPVLKSHGHAENFLRIFPDGLIVLTLLFFLVFLPCSFPKDFVEAPPPKQ